MTRNEFGAAVRTIVDGMTFGQFDYPASFESELDDFFAQKVSSEDAAKKILLESGWDIPEEQPEEEDLEGSPLE